MAGVVALVKTGQSREWVHSAGLAQLPPESRPMSVNTWFDLASLTKVLVTSPVLMRLVDMRILRLDSEIFQILGSGPRGVTVGHCLSHSSGLPSWIPMFRQVGWDFTAAHCDLQKRKNDAEELVLSTLPTNEPGSCYRYSDVGFFMLGMVIEKVMGTSLSEVWNELIREPAGVDLRWGHPTAAATEECPVRGRLLVGEVHDLNAASVGGVAPHAGLFGTASEVAKLCWWQLSSLWGENSHISVEVAQAFFTTRGAGSHYMGWDGVSDKGSSAGGLWPKDGVGHLAFSGCSIWAMPTEKLVSVVLTNRLHPHVEEGAVPPCLPPSPRYLRYKQFRPDFHSEVCRIFIPK